MTSSDRRTEHNGRVTGWLRSYATRGHPMTFQTRSDGSSSEIVFGLADWDAFVQIMEPGLANAEPQPANVLIQPSAKLPPPVESVLMTSPEPSSILRRARTAVAGEQTETFEVVASGISMEPTIRHGDTLFVSKDVDLLAGRVVVAIHDGTWIVKRLASREGNLVLRSDNVDEELPLELVEVQGVVVQIQRTI